MSSPLVFKSADAGSYGAIGGTAGQLLAMLNTVLIINNMFTGVSGASFVDNTTEAQGNVAGQTAFKLFQGPTVTVDEAYFGTGPKFDRLWLSFGTAGVQNAAVTLAWDYWNGAAWAALSVADGTSGLTASGKVTWAIPGDWATKSVNSVTQYWVRLRFTAGTWTTNPLVNYASITGWVKPFADASSVGAFQQLGGNLVFLSLNDNAPGNARYARPLGMETMSALQTGTGKWPAAEAATMNFAKSSALDSATRAWTVVADDRTFYLFVVTNSDALYVLHGFGDFYSLIAGDSFRNMLFGNDAETAGNLSGANARGDVFIQAITSTITAHYLDRSYTGLGTATAFGKGAPVLGAQLTSFAGGLMQFPNGPDAGVQMSPVFVTEATSTVRGRLRGIYAILHAPSNFSDGDTFSGSGAYVGKTFIILKGAGKNNGVLAIETSDTWDTN